MGILGCSTTEMKVFKEPLSLTMCKVKKINANKINNIDIMWNNLHIFAILYVGKQWKN